MEKVFASDRTIRAPCLNRQSRIVRPHVFYPGASYYLGLRAKF
jgi:hypothetical protein